MDSELVRNSYYFEKIVDTKNLSSLLPSLGFLLNKAGQIIKEKCDEAIKNYHINSKHLGILYLLQENDNLCQIDLGRSLLIDRTTMINLIDDLEKEQYVQRIRDSTDRRIYNIHLTETGKSNLTSIKAIIKNIEVEFLSNIDPSSQSILIDSLIKLIT